MTNKEFLNSVENIRSLVEKIQNHEVVVKLITKNGFEVSDHFSLKHVSYKFNPFRLNEDGSKGKLVLEIQVE